MSSSSDSTSRAADRSVDSFGGYDSIRDTVLVGPLKGNFLASFAVGWACTTVRTASISSEHELMYV